MRSMWTSCVQVAEKAWDACGQSMRVLHSLVLSSKSTWKTTGLFHGLYTFCVRNYTAIVGNITSVNEWLYTQYTGLTKTTTN